MPLAPDSKPVRAYYAALKRYAGVGAAHEQAVKTAFHDVLQAGAGKEWTLVPEFPMKVRGGRSIRYDGALRNGFHYTLGYWEAKDSADDLHKEIQKKIERGYSLQNTLFQAPDRAVLFQDKRSQITHDPNAAFDDDELLALIRRVTHVSVETVRIVEALPDLGLPDD